ncbi:methyltransferase domain-containing protein [Inhella gelatinilytica]|uniref:Methyltransferase domain-containing protein n=1 Tax=Inhella gelatinilytica TaxID=2795030 RepID=A0A931NEQ7_9BURK|nr:methyltransferase domain-containing protein [Inhella gelatinilytica]MBH9553954.1 methyltransferase domain-containing protein [Inhella gelatinilytica]
MDAETAEFYERNAAELAARYESAASPVERYYPLAFPSGARILDVGAGSGRDLAALLQAGYDGYGVEPSSRLRDAALAAHPELTTRLTGGALPALGTPFGGCFGGIVCCAVLMHVPESELFDAALALRRVLDPHGRLLMSIPASRTDVGQNHRDNNGRLFHPYLPEELQLLFERLGFQLIGRWDTEDVLRRGGTSWVTLLFELRSGGQTRAIDQIEGILNRDRKVATYKFALFRALAEISTQEPRVTRWLPGGRVAVPIDCIARRWLRYYWPIIANDRFVPQSLAEGAGNLQQPVAFRAPLQALIQQFADQGTHGGLTAWHLDSTSGRLPAAIVALEMQALRSIARAIRSGPVTYAGGSLESGRVFEYDAKTKAVLMSAVLWRELSLLGHWIVDAVIVRWAALTERFAQRQGLHSGDVLPLLLAKPEPERATAQARAVFLAAGPAHCVWSGRQLCERSLAVDHLIPFALWGNNDLWNLVPAHAAINCQKSDKLPAGALLVERRDHIVDSWSLLRDAMPEAFDGHAMHLLGSKPGREGHWRSELFARLREAVEVTALQRGVERWTPKVEVAQAVSIAHR